MAHPRETFNGDPHIQVISATPQWTHLRIIPAMALLEKLGAFVRSELSHLPTQLAEELSLAIDELLSNSMEHGCHLDARCSVEYRCLRTPRMVMVNISDAGDGFSMDDATHAAVNNPPEEPLRHTQFRSEKGLRPGGFGILLVRKIADELIYNELGNEVVLVKYL